MLHNNDRHRPILVKLEDTKGKINFNINPKKHILNSLAQEMKVLNFTRLNFFGSIQKDSLNRWQLSASLNFNVVQECVVTLQPVTSFIKTKVVRVYIKDFYYNADKNAATDLSKAEYEKFEKTLNLMDILLEELSLSTPEYPKVENISKVREKNTQPIEDKKRISESPFRILKQLDKKNKSV